MNIVDDPPWRAYDCIAFFKEKMDGALKMVNNFSI